MLSFSAVIRLTTTGFGLALGCDNHLRRAVFDLGLDHFPDRSGILIGHLLRLEAPALSFDQIRRELDRLRISFGRDFLEIA
jgi:hypothetical protein